MSCHCLLSSFLLLFIYFLFFILIIRQITLSLVLFNKNSVSLPQNLSNMQLPPFLCYKLHILSSYFVSHCYLLTLYQSIYYSALFKHLKKMYYIIFELKLIINTSTIQHKIFFVFVQRSNSH